MMVLFFLCNRRGVQDFLWGNRSSLTEFILLGFSTNIEINVILLSSSPSPHLPSGKWAYYHLDVHGLLLHTPMHFFLSHIHSEYVLCHHHSVPNAGTSGLQEEDRYLHWMCGPDIQLPDAGNDWFLTFCNGGLWQVCGHLPSLRYKVIMSSLLCGWMVVICGLWGVICY